MDKNAVTTAYGGAPAFHLEEEDIFLNQGLRQIIYRKFTGNNTIQQGFESSIKRVTDLQQLVKTDFNIELSPAQRATNCYFMPASFTTGELSTGHRERLLFVNAVIKDGAGLNYPCKYINHSQANRFLNAYNNQAWIPEPVVFIENDTLYVIIDDVMLQNMGDVYIDITYVDAPPVIDYTQPNQEIVDIPDDVMMEAINEAASIALENIESQRTSSKLQINTLQE